MTKIIVKGEALIHENASRNELLSVLKEAGHNISVPSELTLPYTLHGFTLLEVTPVDKPAGDVVLEGAPTLLDGTWTQVWTSRSYTTEEEASAAFVLQSKQAAAAKETAKLLKMEGVAYTDSTDANTGTIMCSATKEDMWGLNSVNTSLAMGSPSENFDFDNGNRLVLTPANATEFMGIWAPFRRSFFQ